MKSQSPRRETERSHLIQFMRIFEDFPEGDPHFVDKPDLIVYTGVDVLGVEHTEIFRLQDSEVKLQGQEKYQDRIATKAQEIHGENNNSLFSLNVLFDPHFVLKKSDIEKVANELVNFVGQLNIEVGEEGWIHEINNLGKFPSGISDIYIKRVDQPDLSLWAVGRGSAVPELTALQMQNVLDEKELKLSSYRSKCEKVWLLLVTDKGKPSSAFNLPNDIFNHIYRSEFDRVFHLDVFLNRVKELHLKDHRPHLF